MTFTDEDLKRLKEKILDGDFTSQETSDLEALLARLEAIERMERYLTHDDTCILNYQEAGEPTSDGGYRTKFKGKWYQSKPIDETPQCDCDLEEAYKAWRKECGK